MRFLAIVLALLPVSLRAADLQPYDASSPTAPAVTETNLLASERFWPFHVTLTKPFEQDGKTLRPNDMGVLIRVERTGLARIDFGRDGLYEVPIGSTDLLKQANRVRRGELRKLAPNFVLSIAPRLVDSAGPTLAPYEMGVAARYQGFLTVFADPDADSFAGLAESLTPSMKHPVVLTILFPMGEHPDAEMHEKLRSLGWTVPFVYDPLADTYVRSLLDEKIPRPGLVLQTQEGRVLFQSGWSADVVPRLTAAMDDAFGSPKAKVAVVAPESGRP